MADNASKGFPSPTGVNYYESLRSQMSDVYECNLFPSPTGVNYYELKQNTAKHLLLILFPSPTGVNYYEFSKRIIRIFRD